MFGSLCSSWRRFNARNHHKSCKIVVVGDGSCGKTCLLSVYSQQKFPKVSSFNVAPHLITESCKSGSIKRFLCCDYETLLLLDVTRMLLLWCYCLSVLLDFTIELYYRKLLLNNHLYKEYKPTVFENYLHNTTYGSSNKPIEIGLWDTAGQEDYDRLRSLSYSGADVILLCFTIEKPSSLQNIMDRWFPEVRHFCARTSLLVVGLKSDLRSQKESMEIPVSVEQVWDLSLFMLQNIPTILFIDLWRKL